MENHDKAQLQSFLKTLPPVEFCCVYGSSLHPNNPGSAKSTMVDCILGVSNPQQWHSENLTLNNDHYAAWMVLLGGARLITDVADEIGVGVHFNPFVSWDDKMFKYGVVRMHDLVQDILNWERFYLSGRLQKPVHVLLDNLDVTNVNSVNLRAAMSAALLLLPSKFTEEQLYAKICSLSYMGDLRMLFAEDRNKDGGLSAAQSLVSSLPPMVRSQMAMKLGEKKVLCDSGRVIQEIVIGSKDEAAKCMQTILQRKVMVSSARQAVSGLLAAGGITAMRYVGAKMSKAWKSWR
ncbi:phosphatidate cytidylyltransferase, mitochondrial-like isoform X2 [Prunus dulcis]|uniref:phosphatidate cytidylyltransferase, mitochondrial-like isoform X2 n=1 Tax=Prunus dulcis TaxID=3755 RepID=UPI001482D5A2|nr:phosphatidate cytidylyltransferase, mitochondrial-like isoform X2 [Prunus dulcis]